MFSLSLVLAIYDRANQAHRSFQSDKDLAELNKTLKLGTHMFNEANYVL